MIFKTNVNKKVGNTHIYEIRAQNTKQLGKYLTNKKLIVITLITIHFIK